MIIEIGFHASVSFYKEYKTYVDSFEAKYVSHNPYGVARKYPNFKEYLFCDQYHNLYGPAYFEKYANMNFTEYYIAGKKYSYDDWLQERTKYLW